MLDNIHDHFFKSLFLVNEDLQDLLRGTLPRDILCNMHLDSLEYDPTEYVDDELASHFRDLCCNLRYGEQQIKLSLLYEHKSYPDKHTHLQLLGYILNVWESQADNKQELTPVVCVVLYHGKSLWPHIEFLRNAPEELIRYLPLFDFVLFDTRKINNHAIVEHFQTPSAKIGVWFLKQREKLIDFIEANPVFAKEIFKEIHHIKQTQIGRFVFYLYNVSGDDPDKISRIMEDILPEIPQYYNKHHRKLIRESMEEGMEKGIEKGLVKTALNMIKKGYSDEQIAESTELSIKRIQNLRKESPA